MSVLFCRHGETVFNRDQRFQGVTDSPLTEKGREQAKKMSEYLHTQFKPDLFYISPAPRVMETYQICTEGISVFTEKIDLLQETSYGSWDGKLKSELRGTPEWLEREKDRFYFRYPGSYEGHPGESYADLYGRLVPFFEKIQLSRKQLVVISHLGVMICAKKYFNGMVTEEINVYRPSADIVQHINDHGIFHEIQL